MSWKKLGHIYQPDGRLSWARSHAANPTAEIIDDEVVRIYFSSRDEKNRSSVSYVDIDMRDPLKILNEASQPVLTPGELAMFDDSGASIGCILQNAGQRFLYYMGWHLTVAVPWQNALGLAIESTEYPAPSKFHRHSRFPVVALNEIDPYTISYPWVILDNGKFRMWYGSNIAWGQTKADMRHLIKYAESEDGIVWLRNDMVAVDFQNSEEYAICRPCVIKDADRYRMWFCARGASYRIYYAESTDGLSWTRQSEPDLEVSQSGWDSEMVEYPCVFDHKGRRYMLYSGNAFGKTGFGLAIRE